MNYVVCSIFDRVAQTWSNPFYSVNKEDALRSFRRGILDPNTMFHSNPADYSLYVLGTWNAQSGELLPFKKGAQHLSNADDLISVPESNV